MPSQCFLHVGITFTRFSRATISLQGLPFRPRTSPRTWFWDPTCLLGSELWKASPGLPAADRSKKGALVRLRLGVGPKPGPGHTSQAGSHPDSPGSLLPAYSWPGQALIPTPFTGLTQEERFICPGGRNKMEQSWPGAKRKRLQWPCPFSCVTTRSPLLHKSPPQQICTWTPSRCYLQRFRNGR